MLLLLLLLSSLLLDEEWEDAATLAAERAATVAAAAASSSLPAALLRVVPPRRLLPPTGTSCASVPLLTPDAVLPSNTYTDWVRRASCRSIRVRNGLVWLVRRAAALEGGERGAILKGRK